MKKLVLFVLFVVHLIITASAEEIVEAAKKGDMETVKAILARDPAKLNALDEDKYTSLHWACMRAHWDVAKYLIDQELI